MIIPIGLFRLHEGTDREFVDWVVKEIKRDGLVRKAILVDRGRSRSLMAITGSMP